MLRACFCRTLCTIAGTLMRFVFCTRARSQSRELMEELRKSENEVLRLREILDTLRRDIPSRGQSIEDDRPEDSDHEADESRTNPVENDRKVDQHVKLITRVSEPTCVQSVSVSSVKSEKEQQEREAAVLAANAVYAQEKGVRQASYSTVDDFYKGLDRWLSILSSPCLPLTHLSAKGLMHVCGCRMF